MANTDYYDLVRRRLRSNLETAGIRIEDSDLEGMLQRGFLQVPIAFEVLLQHISTSALPDYLHLWGENSQPESKLQLPASKSSAKSATSLEEFGCRIQAREISPVELAEEALRRLSEKDPVLNAFQFVRAADAMDDARNAEREIANGEYRGVLHGVPVAIKDLLAMRGTPTTAGSKIFADRVTDYDSAGVERLRAAGAIIIGKTRMSEFAYSPGSNNAHYGPTRNPRNLEHDTGGSSSGSAAAVADGIVCVALGSDTGGSIRIPSSYCGLVGLKPTFGGVSLYGADTLSWSLDHLGPITTTVRDAALLLQILWGHDPRDTRTRNVPLHGLDQIESGVRGLRVGVLESDGTGNPIADEETLHAWRNGLQILEKQGATLIPIDIPEFDWLRVLNSSILAMEAGSFHQPILRERLSDYGPFMRQRILSAFGFGPLSFVRAQQARAILRERLNLLFERIDLMSTPTMPSAAPPLGVPGSTALTGPFNLLGWPALTVPLGQTSNGLPLGFQLAGKPWDEATVLRAGRALEL